MNILLVDDEILAIQYIAGLLDWESYGYHICAVAHSVAEAKKILEEQEVNIVIFDVFMPEENGVALCAYIAARYPHIGMLALSSYDTYDFVREILKNGAHDYILKHRVNGELLLSSLKAIEGTLIHNPMKKPPKPMADIDLGSGKDAPPVSHQLALSLEQQKHMLGVLDKKDLPGFARILAAVYAGETMGSTTSRLMITKEILDFLADFAVKYDLSFNYEELVRELMTIVEQQDNQALVSSLVAMYEQLLGLLQQSSGSHYVQMASSYIDRLYFKNISLEKCAKSIGVNASYLSRIFHHEMKITFSKYLSLVRIRMAKMKILKGCPLKQVASECGFVNYNYFFKVFKDVEGITPLGYMEQELGKKN